MHPVPCNLTAFVLLSAVLSTVVSTTSEAVVLAVVLLLLAYALLVFFRHLMWGVAAVVARAALGYSSPLTFPIQGGQMRLYPLDEDTCHLEFRSSALYTEDEVVYHESDMRVLDVTYTFMRNAGVNLDMHQRAYLRRRLNTVLETVRNEAT